MFSIATMASPTTKFVAIVSAINDEVVQAEKPARYITPNVPMSESGMDRLGIMVAGIAPQEHENHQHDQHDRKTQLELDIRHRRPDCIGAVSQYRDIDRRGHRGFQLRQHLLYAVDDGNDIRARLALDVQDNGGRRIGPGLQFFGSPRPGTTSSATSERCTGAPFL